MDATYWAGGAVTRCKHRHAVTAKGREKTKTLSQAFTAEESYMLDWNRKIESYCDRGYSHAELFALRGLLANTGTVHASPSTLQNTVTWYLKSCYKGTSKRVLLCICVLVYFRRKRTGLLAQKGWYPPRPQASAELLEVQPASQPLHALEFKQSMERHLFQGNFWKEGSWPLSPYFFPC